MYESQAVFNAIALERQLEGVAKAKKAGKYKGAKPTARAKTKEVLSLLGEGLSKKEVAEKLEIGIASIYRIVKTNKEQV